MFAGSPASRVAGRIPVINMIMGPPIFAPLLFAIPAYLGLVASFLRREEEPRDVLPVAARAPGIARRLPRASAANFRLDHHVREGRFQKQFAARPRSSLFCGAEAYYSHYKNNYKYQCSGCRWPSRRS